MTMSDDDTNEQSTVALPPQPPTFEHGWLAWQSAIGRLAGGDSPDARIRIEATARPTHIAWSVEVIWSARIERASDYKTLGLAFKALTKELTAYHWEFNEALTGLSRYDEDDWLDPTTAGALGRLIDTLSSTLGDGWSLSLTYQPVEMAEQRVQGRLVGRAGAMAVAGRGRTLLEAVRDVLRSAAPHLSQVKRG